MATILKTWSYHYFWLYNSVCRIPALSIGGEKRFRQLAFKGIDKCENSTILELCCGSGQTIQFLVQLPNQVTGLDVSPVALKRAADCCSPSSLN